MTEIMLFQVLISICGFTSVSSLCYPAPSYQVSGGKYSCRLHQPNWASETHFEITYKHCLENPTINAFIRNFHGVDEINTDFSKLFSRWKVRSFSGKTSQITFQIKTFKAQPKYSFKAQIQVMVIFTPIFGKLTNLHLLTAVFPADDKSDCLWAEKLEMHDQIFLGAGLCFVFILIITVICCYQRRKARKNKPKSQPKVYL